MKKGITLMEMLTASIISVIVIGSVTMYMVEGYRTNERIFIQSQAHAAISLISRRIEDDVKNGATVATNGMNQLIVKDANDNQTVRYVLENNKMMRYPGTSTTGYDMTPFADVNVQGGFVMSLDTLIFNTPDVTTAGFNLEISINGVNSTYSMQTQPFNSKCRNRKKIL